MSLSPRAEAALLRCAYLGTKPTVEALREAYKGTGRDMWLRVLKELKSIGYVAEKTYRVGQRFETIVWVTDTGFDYLRGSGFPTIQPTVVEVGFSDPLSQQSEQNSPYKLNSLNSKELGETPKEEEFIKVNVEVEDMGSWGGMFESTQSDEQIEERIRAERYKTKEKQELVQQKHNGKIVSRHLKPAIAWTASDVSYEFIHRTQMIWGMKVWQPNMKRLNGTFSNLRTKHSTNGEIEEKMLNLFFSSVDFEKFNDPNILWKMFAKRWGELANQVKAMVRTDEEIDVAKSQAKKSQEWLYE